MFTAMFMAMFMFMATDAMSLRNRHPVPTGASTLPGHTAPKPWGLNPAVWCQYCRNISVSLRLSRAQAVGLVSVLVLGKHPLLRSSVGAGPLVAPGRHETSYGHLILSGRALMTQAAGKQRSDSTD